MTDRVKKAIKNIKTGDQLATAVDVMHPALTLLVKLGSIAVHVDEATSITGHTFDVIALKQLIEDPEVKAWLKGMDALAFLPKKRSNRS